MYALVNEKFYQNIEYVYQCVWVCGCVHASVCMGEGVYIKQIICTCCGRDPPARVWTSQ